MTHRSVPLRSPVVGDHWTTSLLDVTATLETIIIRFLTSYVQMMKIKTQTQFFLAEQEIKYLIP